MSRCSCACASGQRPLHRDPHPGDPRAAPRRQVDQVDATGMSALHYAAHDGQLAIVRLLIAHRADAGARYPAHLGGAQPAAAARRRGDAELAAVLEAAPPPPPSPSLGRQCTTDDVTTRASVSAGGGGGGLGWVIPPDCTELDLSRAGIDAEGARAPARRRGRGGSAGGEGAQRTRGGTTSRRACVHWLRM